MNTGLPGSNYDDSDWRSLALLLDQTGVFIWQTDESQRVVFSSRGLQDLVKPTVTDIEGKLFRDLGWITEHNLDDALFTPTSADDARTMSVDFAGGQTELFVLTSSMRSS